MKHKDTGRSRRLSLISPAASWAAALLIAVLIGECWFRPTGASACNALSLAPGLALTALIGLAWLFTRSRARRRLNAVLDVYAQRQIQQAGLVETHPSAG